jgi:phosphatidate cytidylyltransferase
MLKTRAIVAAIALPLLVLVIVVGDWLFALVVLAALLLAGDEYTRLLRHGDLHPPEWLTLALVALAFGSIWFDHPDWREPGLALLLIAGMLNAIWDMEHGSSRPILDLALATLGGVYLGWLGSNVLALRLLDEGAYLTLVLYGSVIVSDSAAYFVGMRWGSHKMSPRTSPKKSWEGYMGGVIAGAVFGALAGGLPDTDILTVTHGAALGLLVGVWGTVGDLGISAIKRQVNAKDSGHLIPGHGGILDRTDSVLVAATVGYCYIVWFVT